MTNRFSSLFLLLFVVFGVLFSSFHTQAASEWICSATGLSFSSQSVCTSLCGGGSCGQNNPFATDQTPYPRGVVPPSEGQPINDVNDALYILVSVIELAQIVFWILTVGFGLYGAYLYLFSGGNTEKAAQARKVFIYAIVAGLLGVIAYGIPGIVEGFVFGF
ncbi:MAG: hypothetical protein AAB903_00130 [Patescibacteria group bacterium]